MSKALHPGKAAFNGILAADLAQRGFTGATRILEGERGFFRATAIDADASRITDGLGERWKVQENCYKLYSCCGHTHTAIDTALDLRGELGWTGREAVGQIDAIEIDIYGPGYDIVREMNPRTPYQAKFSLAYVVAAALLEGWVGLDQFGAERFGAAGVREADIDRLLQRTTVTVSRALTAMYPAAWPARLRLRLADGRTVEGGGDFPRGNPENPVSTTALEDKFRALVAPRYGVAVAEQAIAWVHKLTDVRDMRSGMFEWR
jgi:2-methylcitrate dehydratase PrpD